MIGLAKGEHTTATTGQALQRKARRTVPVTYLKQQRDEEARKELQRDVPLVGVGIDVCLDQELVSHQIHQSRGSERDHSNERIA